MFLYCRVVLQVSGGGITSESGSNLASMITENSNTLNVDIMEVSMGKKKVPRWKGASISLDDYWTNIFLSRLIMLTIPSLIQNSGVLEQSGSVYTCIARKPISRLIPWIQIWQAGESNPVGNLVLKPLKVWV